jgi:hypothetical protein
MLFNLSIYYLYLNNKIKKKLIFSLCIIALVLFYVSCTHNISKEV